MALEDTLIQLESKREGFKARRDQIDAELAAQRASLLAQEVSEINNLVAKARAQGATYGDLKRAYGTKDHRTVAAIVESHQGEIEFWKRSFLEGTAKGEWFTLLPDDDEGGWRVQIDDVIFSVLDLTDGIMLDTETPQWNEDFTIENKVVKDFDGKGEEEDERIREIGEAIRKRESRR